MAINPVETGTSVLTPQTASAQTKQMEAEKDIALMKDAMQIQQDLVTGLLKSLGIGQNVDIVV